MEFVCQLCLANRGKICDRLNRRQITPFSVSAIHQPIPDKEKPLRYKSVFQKAKDKDGQARAADEWQPQTNIKHLWNEGQLSTRMCKSPCQRKKSLRNQCATASSHKSEEKYTKIMSMIMNGKIW